MHSFTRTTLVLVGTSLVMAISSVQVVVAQDQQPEESPAPLPSDHPDGPKKENCTVDEKTGKEICGSESKPGTLPGSAKAAIVIVTLTVVFLILATFIYIRRSRRAAAEADKDVTVEASQVDGPAAILHATYTPETGHSRVYSIGPDSGALSASVPVPLTPAVTVAPPTFPRPSTPQEANNSTPAFPSPSVSRGPSMFNRWGSTNSTSSLPQTAPANKVQFDPNTYPFTGFGRTGGNPPSSAQPPKSALVSSGPFPRPLLAGRLKDRIRERPPSVSSLSLESPK